jgi:uncharacterized membrane protein
MWERLGDLPLHPLAVHAPVILIPLAAAVGLVYAFVPRWQAQTWWAAVGLAIAAPLSAFVAVQSGQELRKLLRGTDLGNHPQLGERTWYAALGLGIAILALWGVRRWAPPAWRRQVAGVLAGVVLVAAVLALWAVIRAGHTGAQLRWGGLVA